ncbi:MAG: hypothetical protein HOO11_04020 [Candidatus Thioglobus sp.]|jgi:hypothetical protein|nr:hypothetical protein [Candidatus Thioglobus sp.]
MKKINTMLFLISCFSLQGVANSQEVDSKKQHGIPIASIMAQLSPDNNDDKSSVLGIELQANFPVSESFVLGVHANLQEQTYGDIAPVRAGGGISLNYYKRLNTMTPYMGIKRTYYDEWIAKTQDALSCLYCSNVLQNYSGMEDFATVGINFGDWIIQLDKRISDNGSTFTESANDPWGVGASYYNNYSNVPDPDIILSVGIPFGSL